MTIKNGKVYRSKASAYQVLIRPERRKWNDAGDVLIDTIPPLTAEFAKHGAEYTVVGPDGEDYRAADIRGHYFDSASAAEENGWSQDEHDLVVNALDKICQQRPEEVWIHTVAPAAKPWKTYDETHHKQIPGLAEQLGLVAEALVYEQQNKQRVEVVERLTELVNAVQAEEELTAA